MKQEKINKILNDLELGYDQMAEKFSHTRKNFWGDLGFIAEYIKNGDTVLDYGCGNGRLLEILKDKKINYTGTDVSEKLIDLAKAKYPEFSQNFFKNASQASLAFPTDFFNAVVSIAVFHHFPEKHAQKMAKELYRVTKPGGVAVVTAWNLWQQKHRKNIFNISALLKKTFHLKEYASFGLRDIFIPFRNNQGVVFRRYHRVYTKRALASIFLAAEFEIEKCFVQNGKNIVIVARKR